MKSDSFYIGIDQGTQSSRAIVFNQHGDIVTKAQNEVGLETLPNNFVEQNGNEILQSIKTCLATICREIKPETILSAGLATQRSGVIAWNKSTGETASPLISWRDRRTVDFIATLNIYQTEINKRSGLRLTPYYGGSKIRWLLQNNNQVQQLQAQGQLYIGPLASYLINRLCDKNPYLIDQANALRMQLLNQYNLEWDSELCRWFEVPAELLPQPVCTNRYFGKLSQTNTPLIAVNGDQTAAMYSLGEMQPGEMLVNLGTGGFVLCPVIQGTEIPAGLLGGLSSSDENSVRHLIEGTINGCGAALNWYKSKINFKGQFNLDDSLTSFNGSLLFINGVNGVGSPVWEELKNEFIFADSLSTVDTPEPDQAVAAIAESILFLVRLNIETMQSVIQPQSIRISGGLANSNVLCQRLADLCGIKVIRPNVTEATARGIAWLSSGLTSAWPTGTGSLTLEPQTDKSLLSRYHSFVKSMNQRRV